MKTFLEFQLKILLNHSPPFNLNTTPLLITTPSLDNSKVVLMIETGNDCKIKIDA